MLFEYTRHSPRPILKRKQNPRPSCGISRLLSAAVINKRFRELLLTDPDQALAQGYLGEDFLLTYQERKLILAIRAENLVDFALQISSNQEDEGIHCSGNWVPANQQALVFDAELIQHS
jgi:hypothetical protein